VPEARRESLAGHRRPGAPRDEDAGRPLPAGLGPGGGHRGQSDPLHVAEAAYVLRSLYGYSREEVRDDLGVVLRLRALDVWDGDRVLRALELMAARDVDFDDAYLALWAAERGDGVASFDGDFARLPVRWREP